MKKYFHLVLVLSFLSMSSACAPIQTLEQLEAERAAVQLEEQEAEKQRAALEEKLKKEDFEALKQRAKDKGDYKEQIQVAEIYKEQENHAESIKWYKKAAFEHDSTYIFNYIGDTYLNGDGVEKDEEEALAWYLRAAERGSYSGQGNAANVYYKQNNCKEALKWFHKKDGTIGLTYSDAYEVGMCYYHGKGVKKNFTKARYYLQSAGTGNDDLRGDDEIKEAKEASFILGENYFLGGTLVESKNERDAYYWLSKIDHDYPKAQYYLAQLHHKSEDDDIKHIGKAKMLYKKACENGIQEACKVFKEIEFR